MGRLKITVIITSYKEPATIGKAIRQSVEPNKELWDNMQMVVIAPDDETLNAARQTLHEINGFSNFLLLRDEGQGKAEALNMAFEKATGDVLILTDGDMYIDDSAIRLLLPYFDSPPVGGVSGHPVSQNKRFDKFGYYSHLFCEAAHKKRLSDDSIPMSGYLYAFRKIQGIFPIPPEIKAEDAYITQKFRELSYKIDYEPNALAYVKFPANLKDWMKQKTRSLGGNVQLGQTESGASRNIKQDLKMFVFPVQFAQNSRELFYSLQLYHLRLYLWLKIHIKNRLGKYKKGAWDRIESTK
jgi:cellulose synthase/poly-beta-1,6-N-acetylglucosamine synthase-like glycosyltransferase